MKYKNEKLKAKKIVAKARLRNEKPQLTKNPIVNAFVDHIIVKSPIWDELLDIEKMTYIRRAKTLQKP